MSRNVVLLLVLGVVVFAVAFSPLGLTSFRIPSSTFSTTTVDGIRIVYDVTVRPDTSKDAPVVVLLHGFSGNRVMMRMISLALADKGFTCASVDLRGFGSSEGLMGSLEDFESCESCCWGNAGDGFREYFKACSDRAQFGRRRLP